MILYKYPKEWRRYLAAIADGGRLETNRAVIKSQTVSLGFAQGDLSAAAEIAALAPVLRTPSGDEYEIADIMNNKDRLIFELGMEFLHCAGHGRLTRLREIASSGFNPNFTHPVTGKAALHSIAATGSRRMLRAFLKAEGVNFLLADPSGKLPSALAEHGNRDKVIARYLRMREARQARDSGEDFQHLTQ